MCWNYEIYKKAELINLTSPRDSYDELRNARRSGGEKRKNRMEKQRSKKGVKITSIVLSLSLTGWSRGRPRDRPSSSHRAEFPASRVSDWSLRKSTDSREFSQSFFFFFCAFFFRRQTWTTSITARRRRKIQNISTSSCFRYDLARSLRHGIHDPRPRICAGTFLRVLDAQIIRETSRRHACRVLTDESCCNKLLIAEAKAKASPAIFPAYHHGTRLRNHRRLVLLIMMNLVVGMMH